MRRGEIFKMRWSNVNFETNEIFIPLTNTKTEESRTVGMTGRLRHELGTFWESSSKTPEETVFWPCEHYQDRIQVHMQRSRRHRFPVSRLPPHRYDPNGHCRLFPHRGDEDHGTLAGQNIPSLSQY
jgi:integrase